MMRLQIFIVGIFLCCVNTNISDGQLDDEFRQFVQITWTNQTFYGFQGIRYAQPPIGAQRFQAPQPYPPSWNLTSLHDLPAPRLGIVAPACPSPYIAPDQHNDDCLYLNVYTRNVSSAAAAPVIVFIHPGGFYILSGNSDHFGAKYLLDHNIVLVTFNYRLGFAGFASTGTAKARGNAGLKDQALVLRWVQQNIRLFGGDPECVTLMGSSAGAMSVVLQMVSVAELSESAPFHRAIVMSGGVLPQLRLPRNQTDLLVRQAAMLNCAEEATPFECVRDANATELAQSVYKMFEFGRDNPIFLWLPVAETEDNDDAFLRTADPLQQIRAGRYARVPILTGTTADELSTSAHQILSCAQQKDAWAGDFQRVGPISLHYERDTLRSYELSARIWQHYFAAAELEFDALSKCFSDAVINFPVERLATIAAAHSQVYRYKFAYRGAYTIFPDGGNKPKIVEHCDELQYLFTSKYWPRIQPQGPDAEMVRRMTTMVAEFAKTGIPQLNPDNDPPWPEYDALQQRYANIGQTIQLQRRPFGERQFWDELFPPTDAAADEVSNSTARA